MSSSRKDQAVAALKGVLSPVDYPAVAAKFLSRHDSLSRSKRPGRAAALAWFVCESCRRGQIPLFGANDNNKANELEFSGDQSEED